MTTETDPLSQETVAGWRKQLHAAWRAYYLLDEETTSAASPLGSRHSGLKDDTYDALKADLEAARKQHPSWRDWDWSGVHVVPAVRAALQTHLHEHPMLSLLNAYSLEEVKAWEDGLKRQLPDFQSAYVAELKVDGVAIALRYRNGVLNQALTRGDGQQGEDVTHNARTIKNLPQRLPLPLDLSLRGEVYYPLKAFETLNAAREARDEEPFKNPRNAAAGALRMLNAAQVAAFPLAVYIHGFADPIAATNLAAMSEAAMGEAAIDEAATNLAATNQATTNLARMRSAGATHHEQQEFLRETLKLPIAATSKTCPDLTAVDAFYEHWMHSRPSLDVGIDGVVIKIDEVQHYADLGETARSPRWAIALKFPAERACARLLAVRNQVGRTGVITPVAELDEVSLAGTTVARATLHNYDQIARLELQIGDRVFVEKGGDIIPKIVAVDRNSRDDGHLRQKMEPPAACPSCGSAPQRLSGEVDWRCVDPACPAQRAAALRHFVSRKAMDIEAVGPALIDQLLNAKLMESYVDLYRLQKEPLLRLERMAEKSVNRVLRAIAQSKTRPLARFIHALGIRYVGERGAAATRPPFPQFGGPASGVAGGHGCHPRDWPNHGGERPSLHAACRAAEASGTGATAGFSAAAAGDHQRGGGVAEGSDGGPHRHAFSITRSLESAAGICRGGRDGFGIEEDELRAGRRKPGQQGGQGARTGHPGALRG